MMLDSGCCAAPPDGPPPLCEAEERGAPTGPAGGPGRSGCVSVRTSSSSSSSSMLGHADVSSTRFSRSFRALRASCLKGVEGEKKKLPSVTHHELNLHKVGVLTDYRLPYSKTSARFLVV